ncbi:MAG: motility protein A [Solirubrobacteraceae bacterium]
MKAATPIGIGLALVLLALGGMLEGTNPASLFNVPATVIIFGGLLGVSIAAFGMEEMKKVPALYKKAFALEMPDLGANVVLMHHFADRARRDGLLALEEEADQLEDPYVKKGLGLVVDGSDPDTVAEVLELEIESMQKRHRQGHATFKGAGGFAPTLGVLGTVMGLLHALSILDQPELLGPAIAGAFMATLYGVGAANIVILPVENRLKQLTEAETMSRQMVIEGLLAVQSGDNPRMVAEKLMAFVPPEQRLSVEEELEGGRPNLKAVDGGAEQKAA